MSRHPIWSPCHHPVSLSPWRANHRPIVLQVDAVDVDAGVTRQTTEANKEVPRANGARGGRVFFGRLSDTVPVCVLSVLVR